MMRKKYEKPELTVTKFSEKDIIYTSDIEGEGDDPFAGDD